MTTIFNKTHKQLLIAIFLVMSASCTNSSDNSEGTIGAQELSSDKLLDDNDGEYFLKLRKVAEIYDVSAGTQDALQLTILQSDGWGYFYSIRKKATHFYVELKMTFSSAVSTEKTTRVNTLGRTFYFEDFFLVWDSLIEIANNKKFFRNKTSDEKCENKIFELFCLLEIKSGDKYNKIARVSHCKSTKTTIDFILFDKIMELLPYPCAYDYCSLRKINKAEVFAYPQLNGTLFDFPELLEIDSLK